MLDKDLSGSARPGQEWVVSGRVEEIGRARDTLTALVEIDASHLCSEQVALPLTSAALPMKSRARERLEGMRVAFDAGLSLADGYNLHRGEWTVTAGGPLRLPTEDLDPGPALRAEEREHRWRSLSLAMPGAAVPTWPVGSLFGELTGVLGHDGQRQRLELEALPVPQSPEPPPAPQRLGDLRIVSLNLLNFWNGDGRGGGFPTERGARSAREFAAQSARTRAALAELGPDLLGVQELENDGFGPDSAARDLLDLLKQAGANDWAVVSPGPGPLGGDVITVGLFYRTGVLEALGQPEVLGGPAFEGLSRRPLAQHFRHRASGASFWAVVNHLKSKGRCPDGGPDADRGDGQDCWNAARVAAVQAQLPWLRSLQRSSAGERLVVMGDMNAWRREDPIRAFREAGFVELVEARSGLPQHSFLYFGQRGTLDYAFATPALASAARQAVIWHINADWPREMEQPLPWLRNSDHDPVVVDFEFSQSATSD